MIIIKLIQFNVSSVDLVIKKQLYFEYSQKIIPVTDIKLSDQKIILTNVKGKKTLTLDQFNARTKQINSNNSLYYQSDKPHKIFGYRINKNQIIFG